MLETLNRQLSNNYISNYTVSLIMSEYLWTNITYLAILQNGILGSNQGPLNALILYFLINCLASSRRESK